MIIYQNDYLRISLLTPRLLRTETVAHTDASVYGVFTDLPTQTVQNRDFGDVEYDLTETDKYIVVTTKCASFKVCKKNGKVVYAQFPPHCYTKKFGKHPLPGTARTLDMANGKVRLEKGITSSFGTSVIDDSKSLLIKPDGSISPRPKCTDRYWFAYGNDYLGQLRDFFKLTGEVPLIPKYALGNW